MLQPELGNGGSDTRGLHQIVFAGTAAGHGAERASACADVAENHECGRSMFAPTLGDIRTHRILTNRVELVRAKNRRTSKKFLPLGMRTFSQSGRLFICGLQ